jgi:hypothetical protein
MKEGPVGRRLNGRKKKEGQKRDSYFEVVRKYVHKKILINIEGPFPGNFLIRRIPL